MKISLNWIKNYVDFNGPVETLVDNLTMSGIEAEKVETVKVSGVRDTVVEFEITPNRPDCLSFLGLAREISARFNIPLRLPKPGKISLPKTRCDVKVSAPDACSRYVGTVVEGVRVEVQEGSKTRQPRQSRFACLTNLGSRLINNVVDATNFCLFETGQPLHAFDLDKLKGRRIEVRFARQGERLMTLDGVERELDSSVLVIADAERPVALAGIMGGANTEVSADTKNILLESAWFDPVLIRRTARKLGLSSDSSYRFERGVCYGGVKAGALRCLDLILETAGGTVTRFADIKAGQKPKFPKTLTLNLSKMNAFLGAKISGAQVKRILKALGFCLKSGVKNSLKVAAPEFRPDVRRAEDLYEEIARVTGYDNLPSSFPVVKISGMRSGRRRAKCLKIADYLLSQGFNEIVSYSLLGRDQISAAGLDGLPQVSVRNPLSREQEMLRPHVLPSILQIVHTNINRGQKDLALFETGKIYPPGGEKEALGIVLTGSLRRDWRRPGDWPFDFFDLKGSVEKMLAQFGLKDVSFCVSGDAYLEEGQRADVFAGTKKLGSLGKIAGSVLEAFAIKHQSVFFAQIDLDAVYTLPVKDTRYSALCGFPAIRRDISLAVDKGVTLKDVFAIVRETGSEHLHAMELKEEYCGEKISAGQRGLVFSVTYQSPERTLTEDEVQVIHENMCRRITGHLGAVIR